MILTPKETVSEDSNPNELPLITHGTEDYELATLFDPTELPLSVILGKQSSLLADLMMFELLDVPLPTDELKTSLLHETLLALLPTEPKHFRQ